MGLNIGVALEKCEEGFVVNKTEMFSKINRSKAVAYFEYICILQLISIHSQAFST